MTTTRRPALGQIPSPPERYDRGNEAQFRRDLERTLLSVTAYVEGIVSDPAVLTAHALVGASHTASGLTTGYFLKALSATTFGFAAHGLTYGDVGAAAASHTHPASQITWGTFGSGDYTFNGSLYGIGVVNAQQLVLASTSPNQVIVKYNDSNLLGITISNAGVVTYDAEGASAKHLFADDVDLASGKVYKINNVALAYGDVGAAAASHTHAASQVTAGTFASGNFLFQGTVGGITTLTAAQLAGIGTGTPQGSFAYDGSNKLDISVGSTGIITYDAFGSGALHSFLDSILLASGKVITLGSPAATGGSLRLVNGQSIQWRNVGDTNNLGLYLDTSDVFQLGAGLQLTASGFLKIGTVQVVGAQGAAVADATGGAVIDAEARTALNALLARVRTHGAIAT